MQKLMVTVAEAADMLGVCRNRVYELIYAERLTSIKLGRSRRIPVTELERFITESMEADHAVAA